MDKINFVYGRNLIHFSFLFSSPIQDLCTHSCAPTLQNILDVKTF